MYDKMYPVQSIKSVSPQTMESLKENFPSIVSLATTDLTTCVLNVKFVRCVMPASPRIFSRL